MNVECFILVLLTFIYLGGLLILAAKALKPNRVYLTEEEEGLLALLEEEQYYRDIGDRDEH